MKRPILSLWPRPTQLASYNNHPFVDGNKRTGFILGILFLELNGGRFLASEAAAAAAVLALAAGEWDESTYTAFLRENATYE